MEWLRNMRWKKAFFLITCFFLFLSFLLVILVRLICEKIRENYPIDGVTIYMKYEEDKAASPRLEINASEGITIENSIERILFEKPTSAQKNILAALDTIWLFSCVGIPAFSMAMAGVFFYYLKCERPIQMLKNGTEQIRNHNLDFQIPSISKDELGELCGAFEIMRMELLQSNQELWRQAEERKRLNAAFSHDLRNPVTVIKGTVQMLRQGIKDEQAIDRLEYYTLRVEQYVEAMSRIQRFDQMPVRIGEVDMTVLETELKETVQVLAHGISANVAVSSQEKIWVDHGIILTVAENLIGNAARYAREQISIFTEIQDGFFLFKVSDDGAGYPEELVQNGPKPFGKIGCEQVNKGQQEVQNGEKLLGKNSGEGEHFGMGLYSCQVLCRKHGGEFQIANLENGGAVAVAAFGMGEPIRKKMVGCKLATYFLGGKL